MTVAEFAADLLARFPHDAEVIVCKGLRLYPAMAKSYTVAESDTSRVSRFELQVVTDGVKAGVAVII